MTVVNKIKQLEETRIPALVLLARDDLEDKSDQAIAKWIIAASPHWRSQGYDRIRQEMAKIVDVQL